MRIAESQRELSRIKQLMAINREIKTSVSNGSKMPFADIIYIQSGSGQNDKVKSLKVFKTGCKCFKTV